MDIKKIFFIDKFARRRKRDRFYFSVGIFLFALAALFVAQRYSAVDALDIAVFRVINFLPGQLFFFLYYIMYTGAFEGAIGITIALLILKKFYIARDVITASFLAALSSGVLKILVNRGRPQDFLHHVIIRGAVEHSPGFPSGHTATAAAIATISYRDWETVSLCPPVTVFPVTKCFPVTKRFPVTILGNLFPSHDIVTGNCFLVTMFPSHDRMRFCLYTLRPISDRSERTFVLLLKSNGGEIGRAHV